MTSVRTLIGAVASIAVLAGGMSVAVAQGKGTAQAPYLRMEWEFDSARGAWQNACGRIFNDRDVAARHVMIMSTVTTLLGADFPVELYARILYL